MSEDESKIFGLLSQEPMHIDTLARYTGLTSSKLYMILVKMQMEGLIKELPGKNFVRGERYL